MEKRGEESGIAPGYGHRINRIGLQRFVSCIFIDAVLNRRYDFFTSFLTNTNMSIEEENQIPAEEIAPEVQGDDAVESAEEPVVVTEEEAAE